MFVFSLILVSVSCGVSDENLCNCTNLLYNGFVLVGPLFFSDEFST